VHAGSCASAGSLTSAMPSSPAASAGPPPSLAPVTTAPAPADPLHPEALQQTSLLLDYPTPPTPAVMDTTVQASTRTREPHPSLQPNPASLAIPDPASIATDMRESSITPTPTHEPPADAAASDTPKALYSVDILRVSRSMEKAPSRAAGGAIAPAADGPGGEDNPNDCTILQDTRTHTAGSPPAESAENPQAFARLQATAYVESTTEREKKDFCARARASDISATSKPPDAGRTYVAARAKEPPTATPSPGPLPRPVKTPVPPTLPITEDLRAWAAVYAPGLDLAYQREKFLQYCRAKHYRFADWPEELKGWLLEAHHRAPGNGHSPAVPQADAAQILAEDAARQAGQWTGHQACDEWGQEYDWRYGATEVQTATALHPATTAPSPEDGISAEAGMALAQRLAGKMRCPGRGDATISPPDSPLSPSAALQHERARLIQAIRESSRTQRSGEVDWRARELLEEAIGARQGGYLTGEQLGVFKQRLRTANSMAELDAIAAQLPDRTPLPSGGAP
jgi:hypothetical protein